MNISSFYSCRMEFVAWIASNAFPCICIFSEKVIYCFSSSSIIKTSEALQNLWEVKSLFWFRPFTLDINLICIALPRLTCLTTIYFLFSSNHDTKVYTRRSAGLESRSVSSLSASTKASSTSPLKHSSNSSLHSQPVNKRVTRFHTETAGMKL